MVRGRRRVWRGVWALAGTVGAIGALSAGPAVAAGTEPIECFFEPGDVPGVDVFFPGVCREFTSASGVVTILGKGRLPEGFTLERTYVGEIPCFGETGRIIAMTNGNVIATCQFRP